MSLADKVQQYDMMYEEKEDERKEKQQLALVCGLWTVEHLKV